MKLVVKNDVKPMLDVTFYGIEADAECAVCRISKYSLKILKLRGQRAFKISRSSG